MTDALPPHEIQSQRCGYEISRISVRGLFIFLIWFVLTAAMLQVALWFYMGGLYSATVRTQPPPLTAIPVIPSPQPPLQPSPGHDTTPPEDWQNMRDHDARILSSYGWVDREKQITRIPIERAMDLLLKQGLPTATQPTTKTTEGVK